MQLQNLKAERQLRICKYLRALFLLLIPVLASAGFLWTVSYFTAFVIQPILLLLVMLSLALVDLRIQALQADKRLDELVQTNTFKRSTKPLLLQGIYYIVRISECFQSSPANQENLKRQWN